MNVVREYQRPLIIAGAALVALLLIWAVLVSPQNSKLTNLQSKESQLQSQQAQLESKLTELRTEKQNLTSSCADLQKIATEIPTVQSPTDIDAEESSFESQFNDLAASSGVSLAQFSGFTPATTTAGAAAPATSATAGSSAATSATAAAGVTAVPTTLTVQGNFGQMMAFINGLDTTFPRLFVIQKFVLAFGNKAASSAAPTAGAPASASTATGQVAVTEKSPALWTGGQATPATAGPYNLSLTGSIYYTSTPNALDACVKATSTLK
jgi:Tfp pilus assembly protein PilO